MICSSCQTDLPDEAIACWKCGGHVAPRRLQQSETKLGVDPLLVVLTLLISAAFFVCLGWAIPFAIWGNIITASKEHPELAGVLDGIGGIALYASAIGLFLLSWWGSYQIIFRLTRAD